MRLNKQRDSPALKRKINLTFIYLGKNFVNNDDLIIRRS